MKKVRRLYIHFGGDKTGSTSIQSFFDTNRANLLNTFSVAYPPGCWHAQLGSYFSDQPEKYIYNVLNGYGDVIDINKQDAAYFNEFCAWLDQTPDVEVLVLSYEGFISLDDDSIRKLIDFCRDIASEVYAVLYIRPPLSYAVSAMSQMIKSFELPFIDRLPVFPYAEYITRLEKLFSSEYLIIKPFVKTALKAGDVVDDFFHIIGLDLEELKVVKENKVENKSISLTAYVAGSILISEMRAANLFFSGGIFYGNYGVLLESLEGNKIKLNQNQIDVVLEKSFASKSTLEKHGVIWKEDREEFLEANQKVDYKAISSFFAKKLVSNIAPSYTNNKVFNCDSFDLISVKLQTDNSNIKYGDSLLFSLEFSLTSYIVELEMGIHIFDTDGKWAFGVNSSMLKQSMTNLQPGTYAESWSIIANLPEGEYTAGFAFTECLPSGNRELAWFDKLISFRVTIARPTPSVGYVHLPAGISYTQLSPTCVSKVNTATGYAKLEGEPPSHLSVAQRLTLPVILVNQSFQDWKSLYLHPINLSYHWFDDQGLRLVSEGERTPFPAEGLAISQSFTLSMLLLTPDKPGQYQLKIVPVQEMHAWFDDIGFTPLVLEIEVLA